MLTYNHNIITHNDKWIQSKLKPYTLRLLYADGVIPDFQKGTGRQISASPNIWDLTYNDPDWSSILSTHRRDPQRPGLIGRGELLKVLDANTEGVTNTSGMFANCEQLQSVCLFDTSEVTRMEFMFEGCSTLTSIPWFNTSKVICMYEMFALASSLETIPWLDTHNCYDFGMMFWGCENLKYIPCIDTHKAGTMDRSPAGYLHQDFYGMFNGCKSLKTIPQLDTSNGQCMIYFLCDSGVERIPEIDTHNVKDFTAMFSRSALKEVPRLSIDSLVNGSIWSSEYNKPATDAMFANCHNVETGMLDFYNRLKAYSDNKGWNSEYTFNGCGDQTTSGMAERAYIPTVWGGDMYQQMVITSGTNGSVSAVPNQGWEGTTVTLYPTPISEDYIFDSYSTTGCTVYDDNKIDLTHATVYENDYVYVHGNFVNKYNPLDLPPNTIRVRTNNNSAPAKYSYTTYETATLVPGTTDVYDVYKSGTNFESVLSGSGNVTAILGANLSNVTNLYRAFADCNKLTTVALFDISNVTNMSYTFYNCTRLTSLPLFDTSNVTTMEYTFCYCGNLTSLPLFNLSKVSNLLYTFYRCSSLRSLPLFDTSKVVIMSYAFGYCSNITSIPLFDTTNVVTINNAFEYCYNVEHGALALYQQASSKGRPPTNHTQTFYNCGRDTTSGAAELAQIPSDWK